MGQGLTAFRVGTFMRSPHLLGERPFLNDKPACKRSSRNVPIDIGEECVDVLFLFGRFVIQQVGVFPDIHYQHGHEPGDIPMFMERDPVVGNPAVGWVDITKSPNRRPASCPHCKSRLSISQSFQSFGLWLGRGLRSRRPVTPSPPQIAKIIFVQHHPVVFEPQTPSQF